MRILAVSGSLRQSSSNRTALEACARLAPAGVAVTLSDLIGALPHFNQDLDDETPPEPVRAWRAAIEVSDGVLFCSPEYARGISGVMKNALDWLGGGTALTDKHVAVINVSPRARHADESIRLVLATMGAVVVEEASVTVHLMGRGLDTDGVLADAGLATALSAAMAAFAAAIGRGVAT